MTRKTSVDLFKLKASEVILCVFDCLNYLRFEDNSKGCLYVRIYF